MYLLDNVSGSYHLHISLSNKWNDNKHLQYLPAYKNLFFQI